MKEVETIYCQRCQVTGAHKADEIIVSVAPCMVYRSMRTQGDGKITSGYNADDIFEIDLRESVTSLECQGPVFSYAVQDTGMNFF